MKQPEKIAIPVLPGFENLAGLTPNNISDLFLYQASKQPEKPAILEKGKEISYGRLSADVLAYAGFLKKKGIAKGDRVLVFVPVSIPLYKVVLALIGIGAVPVFLDQWSSMKRLKQSAELADCKGLVAGWKLRVLAFFIPVLRKIPVKLNPNKGGKPVPKTEEMQGEDAALITFTTGSSGTPKAAWRAHSFLFQQHQALMKELKPGADDLNMTTLPVFVFSNLAAGLTTILPDFNPRKPGQLNSRAVLKGLGKATTLICSPDFLMRLLEEAPSFDLHRLSKVFTGGAPVFPVAATQILGVFPQTLVVYGSTEAEPIASISIKDLVDFDKHEPKGIPVGELHPDITLKIIPATGKTIAPNREEWRQMGLAQNEIGEIVVAGPHVLKEYYKNPEAQARHKFEVDGQLWHRTGDSGFLNENGILFLTGPTKYLFYKDGALIGQFLVEMKLQKLSSVKEGTILKKGNQKVLILVKKEGFSVAQVREEIAATDIPYDSIEFLKSLPKDPRHHSKIEYGKLLKG